MSGLNSHIDHKALFAAVAAGDEAAFKMLFDLHRAKLFAIAFKWTRSAYAAEEITQDVFISIWTSRMQLPAVKDPTAYIYTIIAHKITRYLKKDANQLRILRRFLHNKKHYSNETEERIDADDSRKFIDNAVAQLSPQKQLIYDLNRNHGKSYEEIADTLHLSPHTVKSHLMQALKFIRNYLKENALALAGLLLSLFR
jgi:RNA polymerase sigma-70 factor (family 1)